jgi:hypothetical protein
MHCIGDDLRCRSPTWSYHCGIPATLIRLMGFPNEHQDLLSDQVMMASITSHPPWRHRFGVLFWHSVGEQMVI